MLGEKNYYHAAVVTEDKIIVYGGQGMQFLDRISLKWKKVPGVTMGSGGPDGNSIHTCTLFPHKP